MKKTWELIQENLLSAVLMMVAFVLSLASSIIIFIHLNGETMNIIAAFFILASLLCSLGFFFIQGWYTYILLYSEPVLLAVSFALVLHGAVYDFTDTYQGIQMFGNPANTGFDIAVLTLIGISFIVLLVDVFLPVRGLDSDETT